MNTLFVEFHHVMPEASVPPEPWTVNVLNIAEFNANWTDRRYTLVRLADQSDAHLVAEDYATVRRMLSGAPL
jgi:hypothetical protein